VNNGTFVVVLSSNTLAVTWNKASAAVFIVLPTPLPAFFYINYSKFAIDIYTAPEKSNLEFDYAQIVSSHFQFKLLSKLNYGICIIPITAVLPLWDKPIFIIFSG